MRRNGGARKGRGFSLIEVLLSVSVLVVGLTATFFLVGVGASVNSDSRQMAQAQLAAQQQIEILRALPYETLKSIVQPSEYPEGRFLKADGTPDASRPGDTGYPGAVSALSSLPHGTGGLIITDDTTFGSACKHVTVVIRWTERGNVSRSFCAGTLIAEGGIGTR